MIKLGLTGGVATGKSAVAAMLAARKIPVLDTDELARRFTQPGQPALQQIVARFGPGMLDEAGALRRGELAARVFANVDERRQLEEILHPLIRSAWLRQLVDWRETGEPIGCVVIPLLYETRCETEFDAVICTGCSAGTQQERLRQRGWSAEQINGRLAAQLPLRTKLERADFVIWTEGSLATTEAQLDEVLRKLDPAARQTA
ncbi:MAG TPA: dephospho-CoA kinase [Verrucomicrobiae bacterium]|nr:dephospho-CoA kinase [Verrucomicrobiae bacterium]